MWLDGAPGAYDPFVYQLNRQYRKPSMAPETLTTPHSEKAEDRGSEDGQTGGSLDMEFRRVPAAGQTVLFRCSRRPPLQVVRGFEREDGSALAHLHNVSGGVLGGDRLFLRARVGPGAEAQLTTTGSTRIYRPRADAPSAVQINEIFVDEDALLEYVPDSIIPFAGARFSQRTAIHLAERAGLFWGEMLAPGRQARGEIFAYDRIELLTNVFAPNSRIAAERIRIEPASANPRSVARLGDYQYFASFYICRVGQCASVWMAAEERLRQVVGAMTKPGEVVWGISTLVSDGLLARCLARHGRDMNSGLQAIWREAKLLLYGRVPIPPRKIN
jgi:urease accessory protein